VIELSKRAKEEYKAWSQNLGLLLRRLADLSAEKRQGLSKAVRIEIGEAGSRKRILEDRPNWAGAAPVFAVESRCLKMPRVTDYDLRGRE
jgi:hypothetical protein